MLSECLCALTFMASIGPGDFDKNTIELKDIYSLPNHCVKGSYWIDQDKNVVQFISPKRGVAQSVTMFFPKYPIRGVFQVYYCWGDEKVRIGNDLVPVELAQTALSLAQRSQTHAQGQVRTIRGKIKPYASDFRYDYRNRSGPLRNGQSLRDQFRCRRGSSNCLTPLPRARFGFRNSGQAKFRRGGIRSGKYQVPSRR